MKIYISSNRYCKVYKQNNVTAKRHLIQKLTMKRYKTIVLREVIINRRYRNCFNIHFAKELERHEQGKAK